jgi:hypothetical protein
VRLVLHDRVSNFAFTLTLKTGGYSSSIHEVLDHQEGTMLVLHLVSSNKYIVAPALLDVLAKIASGALVALVSIAVDHLTTVLLQASESVILAPGIVFDFNIGVVEGVDDLGPLVLQSL